MDALDSLIRFAQIKGSIDVQCRFSGRWQVRHEHRRAHALAHIVTEGSGWLNIDGEAEPRLLQRGDVVFFPRAAAHTLSSEAAADKPADLPATARNGAFTLKHRGDGSGMRLFCARFDYQPQADLIGSLPETVFLSPNHPHLQHIIALLEYESGSIEAGAAAVVDALSSVLLVALLRAYLAQHTFQQPGLLQGWRDRRLGRLIQTVLAEPHAQWTVQDMAAAAQLSRAQLMRVFKQQTGFSPHAFVNHVRLQHAAALLKQSPDTIVAVALASGFQSETHFGKAFKKQFGITPGQYRQHGLPAATEAAEYCI